MGSPRFVTSIRFRLTLLYSAILSAVLIAFSIALIAVFNNILIGQYDRQLRDYAEQLSREAVLELTVTLQPGIQQAFANSRAGRTASAQQHRFDVTLSNAQGQKFGDVAIPYQIVSKNGQLLVTSASTDKALQSVQASGDKALQSVQASDAKAAAAAHDSTTQTDVTVSGQVNHVVAVPVRMGKEVLGVVEVADNITHIQATLDEILFYLKLAIPLVLCLATALGWWLAGRALAPMEKIRRLASEISVSDLSRRLHIQGGDELAQLAATFDNMIDRLEQAFARQKQFTSDASHELRTPLAIMQAEFSLALRRRRSVDDYQSVLESAQEEITRMSAIVESLSMLARMDSSRLVLDLREMHLDTLLADLVSRMDVLAAERRIRLIARDLAPLTIQGDERLLKQLVLNLLNNALAYTGPGGTVEVRMAILSKSEVAFHVRDTGVGMPAGALPHIFERFFRVDASRQRNPGGSGLGLAICQSIATAHGGSIGVHSIEGKGSTFTVVLPVAGPHIAGPPPARELADDLGTAAPPARALPVASA